MCRSENFKKWISKTVNELRDEYQFDAHLFVIVTEHD